MEGSQSRAERRRRISERGSDRMDLIAGRIQSLSSSSSFRLLDQQTLAESSPRSPLQLFPDNDVHSGSRDEDETPRSTLPRRDTSCHESSRGNPLEINQATTERPTMDRSNTQPLPVTPRTKDASTEANPLKRSCGSSWPKLFTHKQINSCIIASEHTRACCALIIAVLVVLSYISYPLFGRNVVKSESFLASSPLYIVLLNDVAIVLTRLVLEMQRSPKETHQEERNVHQEDGDNWEGAVKVLETGLVVYQTVRALFIDYSIYVVVVVSGISLV